MSLLSVVHVPKACVADSSTSRSARHKMGSCWGLMLEYLQVRQAGTHQRQSINKSGCSVERVSKAHSGHAPTTSGAAQHAPQRP